jgi:hypothetical protein
MIRTIHDARPAANGARRDRTDQRRRRAEQPRDALHDDYFNPNVANRFVRVFAHAYVHIQEVQAPVDDEHPAVLEASLIDGPRGIRCQSDFRGCC